MATAPARVLAPGNAWAPLWPSRAKATVAQGLYLRLGGCLPCHADRAPLQRGRGSNRAHAASLKCVRPAAGPPGPLIPSGCVRLPNSQEAASSKRWRIAVVMPPTRLSNLS